MKQTKKLVVLLTCLCLMVACMMALASCNDDPCAHTETEWVVVKNATETEAGEKHEVCKECDEIVSTEVIPATGSPEPEIVPVPTDLTLNGTVFTWTAVEGATSYVVKVNNDTYTVDAATFDLSTITLTANTTYAVSVSAVKADGSSEFCSAVNASYLTKAFEVSYAQNTVAWSYVIGASDYEVKVNGSDPVAVTGTNMAKITLTQEGDNLVEVRYTNGEGSDWMQLTVKAYKVTYNPRSLEGGESVEYLATGDAMTLPTGNYSNIGYEFAGWYTAAENGTKYENNEIFTATENLVVYGGWTALSYTLNLGVEGLGITNIPDSTTVDVTYNEGFTLPVPTINDEDSMFAGWFSTQLSSGTKLTDEYGNSIGTAKFTENTTIYPVFINNVLAYELKEDDTYSVAAGVNFDKVSNITIPVTYRGKDVTSIIENGFESHKLLVSINIPNTIKLVGSGAFVGCSSLEAINVYKVDGTHEIFYDSYDGALIRYDMGSVTLEVFPRAKTGTFKTPEGVSTIRNKVFQYSNIDKIIISKDVTAIYERAFYSCKRLTEVEFEGDRETDVVLMCGESSKPDSIFYATTGITKISFPAKLAAFNYTYVLDQLTQLATIEVEAGGVVYSSVDGMFTNGDQDTILYAPLSVSGDFTVPSGIFNIGASAFHDRVGLTSVTIPMYVESVGANAFYGCKNVKTVTIEGNRFIDLTIGASAFASCNALKTVVIGGNGSDTLLDDGAITIGSKAFAPATGVANIDTVTFGQGVKITEIGSESFKNQAKLRSVNFADNVNIVKIGNSAFEGTKITTIAIPASVTSIGSKAFYNNTELKTVNFTEGSNGNIVFGDSAFANCAKITSVYIPSTVTAFDGTVFNGCSALTKIEVAATNPVLVSDTLGVLYDKNYTKLIYYPRGLAVDKATLDSLPWDTLTTIGNAAFSGHKTLAAFEIKKGITEIGEAAFSNCAALTTLTYEAGAEAGATLVIAKNAFANCQALANASIPDYTTTIGEAAFIYADFASFVMPSALTTIGNDAFKMNDKLTSISIPAKVTSIGAGAFSNCTKLATVDVDDSEDAALFTVVNSGTKGVFLSCSQLKTIDLKNRATNIGDYMFSGSGLTAITLGSNVTKIGSYAFKNTKLTTVNIPANVGSIGTGAFAADSASSLTSITFDEGTKALTISNNAFENAKSLTSINLPARLTALGADVKAGTLASHIMVSGVPEVFKGCTALANITVTSGSSKYMDIEGVLYQVANNVPVTLIYCPPLNEGVDVEGVATLTVPKTVTLVENRALYDVQKIKTVTFEEYDDNDPKHNQQLLQIGRGDITSAIKDKTYAAIGGHFSTHKEQGPLGMMDVNVYDNSITVINLPSHISTFGKYAISTTTNADGIVLQLNIPADANNIRIASNAFDGARIVKYNFPGVSEIGASAFAGAFNSTGFTATKKVNGVEVIGELDTLPFEIIFGEKSTLTVLSAHCFNGSKIESFVVPASVVETSNTFYNSTRLKTVTFAEGSKIKTIGAQTFGLCSSLVSVDFSNAKEFETFDGANIFQNCTSLVSFEFPVNTKFVPDNFFTGASNVKKLTLNKTFTPDMLYDLNNAGEQCAVFGSFSTGSTIPAFEQIAVDPENPYFTVVDNVLYSKDMKTLYCYPAKRAINGFTIPSSVESIAHYAFLHYQGSALALPASVSYIGDYAFRYSKLTAVSIGANLTEIGKYSFANCTALKTVSFSSDNNKLTKIGAYAFMANSALTAVNNIPDTVSTISRNAFQTCSSLTSIILPSALTKIEESVFQACSKLADVTIQSSVASIEKRAFYNSGITEVTVPSAVTLIGQEAFAMTSTSALTKVTILENSKLATLGGAAFDGCIKLESINLPDTLIELNVMPNDWGGAAYTYSYTFRNCSSLKEISIPKVLAIPDQAFEGCTSLETVEVGDGLTTIGVKAFYNNTSLESFTVPANVLSIGTSAFENCSAMQTLEFADGCNIRYLGTSETAEDNIFKNTTSLGKVSLPTSLTLIGGHVFENSGIIPENFGSLSNLDTVGAYAFANCDNITKLVVVTSITYLGDYAFFDCDNISDLSLTFGVEYFGELAFGSCDKITDGYIPSTVYTLNGNPYAGCPGVTALRIDPDNAELTVDENGSVYGGDMTVLHYYSADIPAGVAALPSSVNEIAPGAFANSKITGFTFLAKYGEIAPFTFYNCKELATVSIISGITSIGDYAFYGCEKLNNVTIPSSATVTSTVWSTTAKGNVMPTTLGNYAFANCTALSNVTFANTDNIYVIGTHFFENCTAMTEIKLPANFSLSDDEAKTLGTKFFYANPSGYNNRYAPMKHAIPGYMFAGTGIVDAVIPASVYYLETDGVFMNCQKLKTVTFEAPAADPTKNATTNANAGKLSYVYIGNYMFYNCDSLVTIEIPNSNSANPLNNNIGYTFAECDNLETVILYYKPSTTAITPNNEGMFMNCKSLKTLTLYNVSKTVNSDGTTDGDDSGSTDNGGFEEEEAPDVPGFGGITINPIIPHSVNGNNGIVDLAITSPIANRIGMNVNGLSGNNISAFAFGTATGLGSAVADADVEDADELDVEDEEETSSTTSTPTGALSGNNIFGTPDDSEEGGKSGTTTPGFGTPADSEEGGNSGTTIPGFGTPDDSEEGGNSGTTPGFGTPDDSEEGGDDGDNGNTTTGPNYAEGYLDYIGNNYFKGCESLESITIENDAYIGDSAFEGCTSLKEVIFYDPNANTDEGSSDDNGDGGASEDGGLEEAPGGGGIVIGPAPGGIFGTTGVVGNSGNILTEGVGSVAGAQNGVNTLGFGSATNPPGAGTTIPGFGTPDDDVDVEEGEDSGTTPGIGTNPGIGAVTPGIGVTPAPGGSEEEEGGEDAGGETEEAKPTLKYLGNNAFKGCTALTSITLPGIPENAGTGVFDGWTAEQTINLSNTEAELAQQVADGMLEGCNAVVNYAESEA